MKATVRQGRAMASPLRLTLAGSRAAEADVAWTLVERVFDRADRSLTRFDPESALSRLNRAAGNDVVVPPMLAGALALAWRAFRMTRGRFDPRIIGALEAAGEHAGIDLPPSPERLEPGDRWLALDGRRGRARVSAPIDLGGIGKGLALRWAMAALGRAGHGDLLLQAGGDLVAAGRGPAARAWIVGLEDPTGDTRPLTLIALRDAALATSSIAVRGWTGRDGTTRHHLIDPSTLAPAAAPWLCVTVLHRDPAWAEIHSKVAFLAGHGIAEVTAGSHAWWVSPDRLVHASVRPTAPAQEFTRSGAWSPRRRHPACH